VSIKKSEIAIGSDHRGYHLKEVIKKWLIKRGYQVKDFGVFSEKVADYPDIAFPVGEAVSKGECELGILICMTGIGMSIAANKVKGVRAALVCNEEMALLAREHNNANILCMGSSFIGEEDALKILEKFVSSSLSSERHRKRVKKILNYEKKFSD